MLGAAWARGGQSRVSPWSGSFTGRGRVARAGPRAFRVSPIRVSPILEKGVWFVASTGRWQQGLVQVQSMMLSHRLYHPPTCGGHVQWCPGLGPGVRRRLPKWGLTWQPV